MSFVDYAELVWKLAEEGQTQAQIGEALGWSRSQVANYAQLRKLDSEAWGQVVTGVTNAVTGASGSDSDGAEKSVTFSERLLRDPLDLLPAQQRELVRQPPLAISEAHREFPRAPRKKRPAAQELPAYRRVHAGRTVTFR